MEGIEWSRWWRLCCMPQTHHLKASFPLLTLSHTAPLRGFHPIPSKIFSKILKNLCSIYWNLINPWNHLERKLIIYDQFVSNLWIFVFFIKHELPRINHEFSWINFLRTRITQIYTNVRGRAIFLFNVNAH